MSAIEVCQRLTEALSRFGVAGKVGVDGRSVFVTGNGPTVSADLAGLLDQWPGLSEDVRQRRILDLARKLASDRRAIAALNPEPREFSLPSWLLQVAYGAAVVVALCIAWALFQRWSAARDAARAKPVVADYDAYERERADRAARVCEATRSRVMRGAAVGPPDVEGWVVELSAIRDVAKGPITGDPAFAGFLAPLAEGGVTRVIWPSAPLLVAAEGPDTTATLVDEDLGRSPVTWHSTRLVLTGRYVLPYFDETARQDYLRFARALTDALGVDYAALYARCALGSSHHIGSWFRGPTPAGAVTSLVYFMGTFGDHPDVQPALLGPPGASFVDRGLALRNVAAAAAPLKKAKVMTELGPELGAISGKDDQVSTITFPFRDANRSSRASRAIARDIGIADDR